MHIPYPCTKSLGEMKSTSNGFYCGDCKKHLVDMRDKSQPLPEKGTCIITDEPQENYALLNRTYRFALALFIVMGSSLILNNSVYANHFIGKLDAVRETMLQYDSAHYYLSSNVCDQKGRPIKPVKVTIELENGDTLKDVNYYSSRNNSTYHFSVHERYNNTKLMITLEYYGEVKKIEVYVKENETEIPKVEFKRNRKDKYTKKRYKNVRFVGKF